MSSAPLTIEYVDRWIKSKTKNRDEVRVLSSACYGCIKFNWTIETFETAVKYCRVPWMDWNPEILRLVIVNQNSQKQRKMTRAELIHQIAGIELDLAQDVETRKRVYVYRFMHDKNNLKALNESIEFRLTKTVKEDDLKTKKQNGKLQELIKNQERNKLEKEAIEYVKNNFQQLELDEINTLAAMKKELEII